MDDWLHNTRGLVIVLLAVATGILLLSIDPGDGFPRGVGSGAAVAGTNTSVPSTLPVATTTPVTTLPRPTLQQGSTGASVTVLQQRLNALGYNTGTPDGSFGPGTKAQVVKFQQAKGLPANGIVDAATWAALDKG